MTLASTAATLTVVLKSPVTLYCFGDGSGTPCPCGNEVDPGDETGCRNSTGKGASLSGGGLASVSNDTFTLEGSDMDTST